jgi:hypothetical protein
MAEAPVAATREHRLLVQQAFLASYLGADDVTKEVPSVALTFLKPELLDGSKVDPALLHAAVAYW